MSHTYIGYFDKCCTHHIDHNKLNNILFNLQLMTRSQHMALHNKEAAGDNHWNKGKVFSEKHRLYLSISHKGLIPKNKGKQMPKEICNKISTAVEGILWWCKAGEQPIRSKFCPGEGRELGRFKYIKNPNKRFSSFRRN